MARLKFGRAISLRWNGLLLEGPADTVFEIPDEYYEEFEEDIHPVEPTLVWLDSDEGATLRGRVTTLENASGAGVSLSNSNPVALGTTAPGAGTTASRYDHVHPTTGLALSGHNHNGVYDPAGTAASAVSAHEALSDPHPVYLTEAEGDAQYADIIHTHTGLAASYTEVVKQYVKNDSTAKLKGEAVYISSSDGTNPIVSYADADAEATSSKTLGLLEQDLSANQHGYVITEGKLSNINTSAATAGQTVWLSGTSGSRVYGAPPAEPAHAVFLGVVTKANASTGEIFIKVQNGYELDELHDVSVGSPTAGDVIQWATDGTTYMWRKKSLSDAGIAASSHNHTGTYANASHTHAESDVTSLVTDLAGKASTSHDHSGVYDPAGTASSAVSTHAAVTTSVHGISNTANLVYTSDSRLSDSRTPTAHKTTHATGGTDALTASDIGAATSGHTHSYASTTHASTHAAAGSDPLSGISQSQISNLTTDLAGKASTSHTHVQADSHNSPDTDTGTSSLHHTIGTGANQAAAGNHTHAQAVPAGSVTAWLGSNVSIPSGWLLCNGQSVSTTTYAALFSAIGYSFGGSGSSFTVPDLTGNLLVGANVVPSTTFQTGSTDAYLNASWTHAHSHNHSTNPAATASGGPSSTTTVVLHTGSGTSVTVGSSSHTHTTDIAATTSDTDATNSPTISVQRTRVNYIIKT